MRYEPTDGFTDEIIDSWRARGSWTQEEVGYLLDEIERLRDAVTSSIDALHKEHEESLVFFNRAKIAEAKLMECMGTIEYVKWLNEGKP